MRDPYEFRLARFRDAILPARSALVVCHDYPDPDCIAAAFGIRELLRFWKIPRVVITFGGFVGRVENRTMLAALGLDLIPIARLNPASFNKVIMVDSFPGNSNVSLPASVPVTAVFDHHHNRTVRRLKCFHDIRPALAATSTMVTRYCVAAGCPLSPTLATALYYGIKTDSRDLSSEVTAEDVATYRLLMAMLNYRLLLAIENPSRNAAYFKTVRCAIDNTRVCGSIAFASLGPTDSPDRVAEMVDFLSRLDTIEYVVCSGIYDSHLFFSVRSKSKGKAGFYADRVARLLGGTGGGHLKSAAGKIPLKGLGAETATRQFAAALKRIFRVNGSWESPW